MTCPTGRRLSRQSLAIAEEYFPFIGIGTPSPSYGVASNAMLNVTDRMPGAAVFMAPGPTIHQQDALTEGDQ